MTEFLTSRAAAKRLGISEPTFRRAWHRGDIGQPDGFVENEKEGGAVLWKISRLPRLTKIFARRKRKMTPP